MTTLKAYNPPLFGYDFAKEFLKPGNSHTTKVYQPFDPDFGTMLTVNIKKNLFVHSGIKVGVFDHTSYFVHFLLGMLFMSQERDIRTALGIKNVLYLYEQRQLKIVVLSELNGRKTLLLKMVNFNDQLRELKHYWPEEDLKTICSIIYDMNEIPENYDIESHWLDLSAENIVGAYEEEVLSPSISFTADIFVGGVLQDRVKQEGMNMKRKFRKYFRRVRPKTSYQSIKSFFQSMGSADEHEASAGFEKFAEVMSKIFKDNLYGSSTPISKDFSSMTSTSQTGFIHGALTSLQNKFSFHMTVEQVFTTQPGFRINIQWKPFRTWTRIIEGRPLQVYFFPGLEMQGTKHNEVISNELLGHEERTFMESLRSEAFFVYMNLNARGKTCIIKNVQNIAPALGLLKDTKELAAITLKDKIVYKLESLKKLLDIEYSFILKGHMPCSKRETQNYLSRYLHGYFAANEVSRTSGSVFKLKHLNPSDLEKQYLTSFLLKTDTEATDLVINIYEKRSIDENGYAALGDLKKKHVYPITSDQVKHTVVVDYFVSFSTTNKPEYKNHVITKKQAYMKSVNSEQTSDFAMLKITNIDLQQIVSEFDPSKSMRDTKPLLSTIKNYFEENFSYIGSKFELKAAMDGLLYKTKIQSNLIDIRKNVLQVAFLENENLPEAKLCLFNLAFGDSESTIHDLDEMRHLLEEGPIKAYEKVKVINIALTKAEADPVKPLVLENRFLSVLHLCSKPRFKRNLMCSSEETKSLIETMDQSKKAPIVMKRRKYLTALGHVASGVMFGLMAKDFVSDIIRGDITGIAINIGFLFSNYMFHGLAGKLFSKANLLEQEGSIALSNIFKVSSSFLRRSASFAFVGLDLYNSVQAYKTGQSGAMVNIVADSSYLALDMAETAIEISEAFGLIEGVSAVTGPIGWAAGAALLVGADIYRSVEKVNDIDHIVHLSRMEKLAEGFRAFFGMNPEQHVAILMKQKTILRTAVEKISAFLDQHDTIDRFIFPANVEDSGDIIINLMNKEPLTIGRSIPLVPASTTYFCLPKLNNADSSSRSFKAFYCKNALGLRKLSPTDNGTTYILLASGNGTIKADDNESHIYDIVGPGVKRIFGSQKGDTFILRNEKSCGGILAGQLDNNILDVSNIGSDFQLLFTDRILILDKRSCMKYTGIGTVIGRKNLSDNVVVWRGLNHIELHGGNFKQNDHIFIPDSYNSSKTMEVIISGGNTNITNDAIIGDFTYIIMDLHGNFYLNINRESTANLVKLIYNSFSLTMLTVKINSWYATVCIKLGEKISGEIKAPIEHLSIQFQDGADLYVKRGRTILDVTTTYPINDAISIYSELAARINISIVIHSLTDSKTITLNHQALKEKNYAIDIVYASSKHSHFQSMSPEVVYILGENSQQNVTVVVNPKQKFIIDINSLPKKVSLTTGKAGADIVLTLSYSIANSSVGHQLRLENAITNQSYKNIVIKKQSTMVFQCVGKEIYLVAPPLTFSKYDSLIVISPNDGIEYGMKIIFKTKLLQYELYNMNKTDLMLTNVQISETYAQQEFTLILKDFYRNEMMRSLKLSFENATIDFEVQEDVEQAMRAKDVKYLFKMLSEEIAEQSYVI